ncbi:MAG: Co2+/Mg2+ efflux protein ApaG [Rhodospirillaceae bacterium]|nr:Co2+/Mg2+ efflux protein ApaG [Rhodospirillaceae bacterium]MYF85018.1 Co2+/Mg2+ efflux protein ApaG [Rhodospirillaceae bacterium]MYH36187.1 Co2+/Mg2+ efflux protein ApaG [Rhodospirillaceae bacterium]MYK16187.1 Co2+/Mg2+ efflux protein ApaG [Rhodospirillaceae bacterium]MYK60065.1 Co2+/Mg2+ efflux protein ApaG [Rhodospirillaceae bacterium]
MYSEKTADILVSVKPFYLEEQSEPDENRYVWAYTVTISNEGGDRVQLLNRHWRITDAAGQQQEVRGPGVVGEQPVLEPGQSFEYTSGCPLATPSGFMVGAYEMTREDGNRFQVRIPMFSLDSPFVRNMVH